MSTSQMMTLEPILSDEYHKKTIDKVRVLVAKLNHKKHASDLIQHLSVNFPFDLNHLKRINSKNGQLVVIICKYEEINDNQDKITEVCNKFNLIDQEIINVPSDSPLTRLQYEDCIKFWPTTFHQNKYIEKSLNDKLFDSKTREKIFEIMSKAIEMSKPSTNCMAAIITDKFEIKSSAINQPDHPIKHAIMLAIEQIAYIQRSHKKDINDQDCKVLPYLCTSYDIFVTQEPCLMCSMALIHSRIKRLFFIDSHDIKCDQCCDKSLTHFKIHTLKNLNHHYEVWKINMNT